MKPQPDVCDVFGVGGNLAGETASLARNDDSPDCAIGTMADPEVGGADFDSDAISWLQVEAGQAKDVLLAKLPGTSVLAVVIAFG